MLARRGESGAEVSSRLGEVGPEGVSHLVERTSRGWKGLIKALDREDENFEHVRRETADVFFCVVEALVAAEGVGDERRGVRRRSCSMRWRARCTCSSRWRTKRRNWAGRSARWEGRN